MRNFRFFFQYIGFFPLLGKFEPHSSSQSVSDTGILVFQPPQSEKGPTNDRVLRIVKTLPFIHQPDRVAPKASDVSAADCLYQHTHVKKYVIFSGALLRLFSGPEIPVQHRSLCDVTYSAIHQIVTHPVDSVIHPSNNRGQEVKNSYTIHNVHFITTVA